jgi:putative PIN family toxin of toxin-antitoxin system
MTPRLIADINVILFGMIGKAGSLAHRFYQAFHRAEIKLLFSRDLMTELEEVLEYPSVLARGVTPALAFRLARDFYELGDYIAEVPRYDWPSLPDTGDWFLLDLLYATAAAGLITQDKQLLAVGKTLSLPIIHLADGAEKGWY